MLTENAKNLLNKRYLLPGETWERLIRRVATTINSNRHVQETYAMMLHNLDFLPNTPTLVNAGARTGQLMACFVLPIEDSIESIFDGVKHAAIIHKGGGGTGFSFSNLREANQRVQSTRGIASGPVSFMHVYNAATGAIKQGGIRRGANIGILSVHHPDIKEFISSKADLKQLTNFNISVSITDAFIKAYMEDKEYDLISPVRNTVVGKENARDIMMLIAEHAHKNGEPGVVFIDTINKNNPLSHLGYMEATNPCGEQPLFPYEACVLGSINLAHMVKDGDIDEDKLMKTVTWGTMFLDNIIDVSKYPLPQIEYMVKGTRRIGLGVMGWADMLAQMHVAYNSEAAIQLAEKVMEMVHSVAKQTSEEMAVYFGGYPFQKDGTLLQRNATVTTIAPTGSISMIAECSSGIEPYFSLAYTKTVMDGEKMIYVNPYLKKELEDKELWTPAIEKHVIRTGSVQAIADIPEDIKEVYKTSAEIPFLQHIKMQAAFQKHTDNAVSKTINLPKTATIEDVLESYVKAYELNCKGITVYRDGSRDAQVLSIGYQIKKGICPECESKTEHAEGCIKCPSCGWAVCE